MTVCRAIHDKSNPYTVINKSIVFDCRLSLKAKGLWLYAFSRPDDWQFYISEMTQHCTDGPDSIKTCLKELIACGYLFKIQNRGEKGKFQKFEWHFFETSKSDSEIKKMLPEMDFPLAVEPTADMSPAVKHTLLSKEILSKEELNKEEREREREVAVAPRAPDPIPLKTPLIERALHVSISDSDHAKLLANLGPDRLKRAYEKLSIWKQQTPKNKWKRHDYLSICGWVTKALDEEDAKASGKTPFVKDRTDPYYPGKYDDWDAPIDPNTIPQHIRDKMEEIKLRKRNQNG